MPKNIFNMIPTSHSVISFDIIDFYPSIFESLLDQLPLSWASSLVSILKDFSIIKHRTKSSLFNNEKPLMKIRISILGQSSSTVCSPDVTPNLNRIYNLFLSFIRSILNKYNKYKLQYNTLHTQTKQTYFCEASDVTFSLALHSFLSWLAILLSCYISTYIWLALKAFSCLYSPHLKSVQYQTNQN